MHLSDNNDCDGLGTLRLRDITSWIVNTQIEADSSIAIGDT